jgi:DNA invertase Pin-like site-specific DNA recombinase
MRLAVGIIRVSESRGREGDTFISPEDQRKRIEDQCGRMDLSLVSTVEEIDVSGGTPLVKRDGLREAVEAIEAGEAEVLIVGYFDRLVRSLKVQGEVVSRVEAAGGEVLAVDFGRISEETAVQWLSGTMVGAVHEYHRRSVGERTGEAQADAVARGVPPFAAIPPGYRREIIGVNQKGRSIYRGPLLISDQAPIVHQGFEMRADNATFPEIRRFLREHGIIRSQHAVYLMFSNRLYLGELRFGKLVNLNAHEALVSRELFNAAQRTKVPRGRYAKSDRLLARLGVLRHEVCGSRMVAGSQVRNGRSYPYYRCPPSNECTDRVTITAEIVEEIVAKATREALADEEGRASAEDDAQRSAARHEKAQADLDAAFRAFAGMEDEAGAVERLRELREARDVARAEDERLSGVRSALVVTMEDWDRLSLAARRKLIKATVETVTISNIGRGAERVTVKLFRS